MADIAVFDARWHCVGNGSGRLWVEQVIRHLAGLIPPSLVLKVVVRKGHAGCVPWCASDIVELPSDLRGGAWAEALTQVADYFNARLVLTHYCCAQTTKRRQVIVVHDILFEDFPDLFTANQRMAFSATRATIPMAWGVITVSQYTHLRLLAHGYLRSNQRVTVIPNGVSHVDIDLPCPHNHQVPMPYVMYLGRLTDRKNLHVLAAAASEPSWPAGMKVLVCGSFDGVSRRSREAVADLVARGLGLHLQSLPDACVYTLLKGSEALVYVPVAEGFGLPVAEAAALRVAAITTTIPAAVERELPGVRILRSLSPAGLAKAVALTVRDRTAADESVGMYEQLPAGLHWRQVAEQVARVLVDGGERITDVR